jgi:hypothetical protein
MYAEAFDTRTVRASGTTREYTQQRRRVEGTNDVTPDSRDFVFARLRVDKVVGREYTTNQAVGAV